MTDWHESMRQVKAEQPAVGYPVVSRTGEPIICGNHSLIVDAGDSMQCISSGSMKRLYAAGAVSVKKLDPWLEYTPRSTAVKPTQRPIISCSRKNVDTVDEQDERDRQRFKAKAYKYRSHLPDAYHHHHKPIESGGCPEDHVGPLGEKGRHKPDWCRSTSIFDPITATDRPIGSPGRVEMRPRSAPPQRPGTASSSSSPAAAAAGQLVPRRPGTARLVQGRYNPITHTWLQQPDPAAQTVRQRESDRLHGARAGVQFGIRSPTKKSAAVQPPWAGCYDTHSPQQDAGSNSSNNDGCNSTPAKMQRRKAMHYNGNTWGTYDVLRHEWKVPPKDARFVTAEAAPNGIHFDRFSSSHTRRVPLPANQGVYDPIKGEWKQRPSNVRVMAGCEFSPKKVFEEKAFVKR